MSRMIPDRTLEEIRTRTSIVDVVSSRVPLRRAGSTFKACCPFHKEKTPSFTVNPNRQSFKCFGCGEGGDVFSFLMKHDGMTFVDSVKMLADRCGVELEFRDDGTDGAAIKRLYALHTEMAAFYRRCLLQMKSAESARAYLKSRALSDEIVEAFQIGYAPLRTGTLEGFAAKNKYTLDELVQAGIGAPLDRPRQGVNLYDRFRGRLMFPICDTQGRVIAFSARVLDPKLSPAKYVNSPETDVFKKSRVLYGLDKAQRSIVSAPHREAIVCEGQIDVIRCHASGFSTAVAAQGTAFTDEQARLLKRYADSAVLVFDQDAAGQKAAVRTGSALLAAGIPVRVAQLDVGEDPDSFLCSHPPEAFQRVLDAATGLMPFHVAFLQAQEQDPESDGAVGRIAAGVLQTVAVCENEIHKARMLQEVAELLRIPITALERELAGVEEQLRRQAERFEKRAAFRDKPRERPAASSRRTTVPSRIEPIPFEEPMVECDPEMSIDDLHVSGSGASQSGLHPPDKLDISICELLIHNFYDHPDIPKFLSAWLPAWLVMHVHCRCIVDAYYTDLSTGQETVVALQNNDPEIGEFVGSIAVMPNRTGFRETFSALDIAQDLVLGAWKRWTTRRRAELHPAEGQDDTPEAARRRSELSIALKQLDRWETGEVVIRDLLKTVENAAERVAVEALAVVEGTGHKPAQQRQATSKEAPKTYSASIDDDGPPSDDWMPDFDEEPDWD